MIERRPALQSPDCHAMTTQTVEPAAFHGLTKTELERQIKVNASYLFPHLCHARQNSRENTDNAFDIVVMNNRSGKMQAKLLLVANDLTAVLAESIPQGTVMRAFMALLCTLADALGQRHTNLLEAIHTRQPASWGYVAKDEVQVAELGISWERHRRQQGRMQKLLQERGRRSQSMDNVKCLCSGGLR
ncbi:hypothetical protein AC578_9405 [Pseudocercospora eumusae]|uniref:Uncharacterized protein n=1 Tax=Pseudocercospora eumusae TaxID=321146 RepID=A0A139H6P2_9PEZI|nr:hypothetical protein AC578_9405 [Pseudocercospora eumusae]